MNAKDAIKSNLTMARMVTDAYLSDLADADLLVRPVPGMNHIAWQIGHIIASEWSFLNTLGHKAPPLPEGFEASHTKETATSNDPKKFLKKADYLALWQKVRAATLAAIDATPEANLDKPGPESMREYAPTIGAVLNLVGQHELMHAGQYVAVRRKLGKPVTI